MSLSSDSCLNLPNQDNDAVSEQTDAVCEQTDVVCRRTRNTQQVTRLRGLVQMFREDAGYGFIVLAGAKQADAKTKQWHFHINYLNYPADVARLVSGAAVEFTERRSTLVGRRDSAIDIEVLG